MPAGDVTRTALLLGGVTRLREAGHPAPREAALKLLAGHRNEHLAQLLPVMDAVAPPEEIAWFGEAIGRLLADEPIAYLIGRTGFRHLELLTDRRALIPRPETESVVGEALARVTTGVAVDIGTGTGAIALALRQEGKFDRVLGIDLSPETLALAAENGRHTGLQVEWLLGDLTGPLTAAGTQVDLVVSNPPYLTEAEYGSLDRSVRDYEPALALVSGRDGMAATARLLDETRAVLREGGWLVLEIDTRRADDVAMSAIRLGWQEVHVLDDLFGRARILVARRGTAG